MCWLIHNMKSATDSEYRQGQMRKFFHTIINGLREDFGQPISLIRMLSTYPKIRVTLGEPSPCIDADSVPRWHELGNYPVLEWPQRDCGVLTGWKVDRDQQWRSFQIERPEYAQLGQRDITPVWSCDITAIHGFAASKSNLRAFISTDEMVEKNSPEMIDDISPKKLAHNLRHSEIRILNSPDTSDHFKRYLWDGRLWLVNDGGSHHTAAAKYIAARLSTSVKFTGKLYTYSLNPAAVASLRRDFEMFVISDEDDAMSCDFFDAMRAFRATWLWHPLPRPYEGARAILLPKSEWRSMRVASELRKVGIADLGTYLTTLATRQFKCHGSHLKTSMLAFDAVLGSN
jgi:hypothetical protein